MKVYVNSGLGSVSAKNFAEAFAEADSREQSVVLISIADCVEQWHGSAWEDQCRAIAGRTAAGDRERVIQLLGTLISCLAESSVTTTLGSAET